LAIRVRLRPREEVTAMQEHSELLLETVDLGDIDTLEEDITPCTGCGCECYAPPPPPTT
jgi:hypothetical protein